MSTKQQHTTKETWRTLQGTIIYTVLVVTSLLTALKGEFSVSLIFLGYLFVALMCLYIRDQRRTKRVGIKGIFLKLLHLPTSMFG
jgi:TRAP-type mannitol/chloroaromatic compound transport system permease large subunit